MDAAILRAQLQQLYRRDSWRAILGQLLPNVEFFAQPQPFPLTSEREQAIASARRQIGVATLPDETDSSKKIAVYEVDVRANLVDLPRNRVALRELVARAIDQVQAHAVLAFFIQPDRDEYRLTYAARETELDIETLEIKTRETAPKRFTFLLGPAEPCRTAAQRLGELLEREDIKLRDVERAFSVERLNKEFFKKYKEHYQSFVNHLINDTDAPTEIFKIMVSREADDEFDRACKPVRDFVKRLLGRIVFLHFLQRKGWLGCAANSKEWKNGDRDFMLNYFKLAEQKSEAAQFHSKWLTPLFFDALNNPERPRDLFAPTNTRIPYLNGGLFEEAVAEARAIDLPENFFCDLLEFFAQYNFTIDENDPEENEVGIDPEMLGHIFENLLEDNKDKGAYYTPKAIVQYMCQQALVEYLRTHLGEHPELDRLVLEKDPGDRGDGRSWIREHGKEIEQLIDNVKICDPAVGSGAFPIGMLNEMLQIKLALDFTLDPHESKKALVENCLHGVDIDPGAIEIARLRFWLSLVVDAKAPEPLPNLDYKLYCADSLIERVRGEAVNVGTKTPNDPQLRSEIEKLVAAKHKLYVAHSKPDKREARHELYLALSGLAYIIFSDIRNNKRIDDATFGRFVAMIDELRAFRRRISDLTSELKKKTKGGPSVSQLDRLLDELQAWFENTEKPTFLWQLHFGEIFAPRLARSGLDGGLNLGDTLAADESGGFDVVIENPPYVRQESIKEIKPLLKRGFACYTGTADLFVYFYERSVELLRDRGTFSIITSNKYYRSGYGEKLRDFLAQQLTLHTLIDFGDAPVFEAISYASILVGTKSKPPATHGVRVYNWRRDDQLALIIQVVARRGFDLAQSKLTPDGWRLEQPDVHALLAKLRSKGTPLGKYVHNRFYNGVKAGRDSFVIDAGTRDQLIHEEPECAPFIRPYLRGRDLKKWGVQWAQLYLLYIPWHFPLHDDPTIQRCSEEAEREFRRRFPNLYRYLLQFREDLEKRDQAETGIRYEWYALARPRREYEDAFREPKIILGRFMNGPTYAFDEGGFFTNDAQFLIAGATRFLVAILNSHVTWWFLSSICTDMQNGYLQALKANQLPIPIPPADEAVKAKLTKLAEACQEAAKTRNGARLQALEAEIDQIVYRLFDLTPEEIALIENSTRCANAQSITCNAA